MYSAIALSCDKRISSSSCRAENIAFVELYEEIEKLLVFFVISSNYPEMSKCPLHTQGFFHLIVFQIGSAPLISSHCFI